MAKKRTRPATLLEELQALERRPPSRTNRLIARHLECEESLKLSYVISEAVRRSSGGSERKLEAPTEMLPPLA